MNIFYLHNDTKTCAELHVDKHVVKMIVEYAQLLSTAKRMTDGIKYEAKSKTGRRVQRYRLENPNEEAIIYKAGWLKHPSTQWVMSSSYNYMWLYRHMMALNNEYKLRYNHTKDHMCVEKLGILLSITPKNSPLNVIGTDATPAMPEECKVPGDSVASYRKYYIMKKKRFATWKQPAEMPVWVKEGVASANV